MSMDIVHLQNAEGVIRVYNEKFDGIEEKEIKEGEVENDLFSKLEIKQTGFYKVITGKSKKESPKSVRTVATRKSFVNFDNEYESCEIDISKVEARALKHSESVKESEKAAVKEIIKQELENLLGDLGQLKNNRLFKNRPIEKLKELNTNAFMETKEEVVKRALAIRNNIFKSQTFKTWIDSKMQPNPLNANAKKEIAEREATIQLIQNEKEKLEAEIQERRAAEADKKAERNQLKRKFIKVPLKDREILKGNIQFCAHDSIVQTKAEITDSFIHVKEGTKGNDAAMFANRLVEKLKKKYGVPKDIFELIRNSA